MAKKAYKLAASIVCADMLSLGEEVERLNKAKIDSIHFDVMDGVFVPRYGLHPEMLKSIRSQAKIPIDVHMMVANPEPYIEVFSKAGGTVMNVHVEACPHLHRTLTLIKTAGMKAGVALNPATPLSTLDYVLDDIDMVVLMAIDPGVLGQKLIPGTLQKIRDLKQKLGDRKVEIEIDGGVTPETAPKMIAAGATMLVCGTGTIYRPHEAPVDVKAAQLRGILDK